MTPDTVVVNNAVRVVLQDTTLVREALTQLATGVPKPLDVRIHDSVGLKDVVSWVVQLAVALGAAYLGAWLGGKGAKESARDAIKDEWDLERSHDRERFEKRVMSSLRRIELLSERVKGHDPSKKLGPDVAEELEIVWNFYHGSAESAFIWNDDNLSYRLDRCFADAHALAEAIKILESKARELDMEIVRDVGQSGRANIESTRLPSERKELQERLHRLAEDATPLLREVRAVVATR